MSSQPHAPDFTLLSAMPFRYLVEFTALESAPRFARKRATAVLAEWGLADLEYPASMIISELVTNSMRAARQAGPHGRPPAGIPPVDRSAVGMEPANQPPARLQPADMPLIRVWMRGEPAGVYVLVHDGVPRAPRPRDASDVDELDESGRGLAMIIPEFCAECGWYPTTDGKVTWALIRNPAPNPRGTTMADARCSCGFTESGDEHLIDHLLESFTPPDSRGTDGQLHEELSHACACGFIPATPCELDQHFLASFTPANAIGPDAKRHQQTP
jgi:hypothetical protein